MLIGRFRSRDRRMLGGCYRRYSPRRRSPLHLSDWACLCDRPPLVWQLRPRRQCIELPGEEARLSRDRINQAASPSIRARRLRAVMMVRLPNLRASSRPSLIS